MDDLYITENWESYGFTREEYEEIQQCIDAAKDLPAPTKEELEEFRAWLQWAEEFGSERNSYKMFKAIRNAFKALKEKRKVH